MMQHLGRTHRRLAMLGLSTAVAGLAIWQMTGVSQAATPITLQTENLTVASSSGGAVATLSPFNGAGTSGISFAGTKVGSSITYKTSITTAGYYDVAVGVKENDVRGIFQMSVQGDPNSQFVDIGPAEDNYSASTKYETINVGRIRLGAGDTRMFRFTEVGKNSASKSYQFVADYIKLTPVDVATPATAAPVTAAAKPAATPTTTKPVTATTAPKATTPTTAARVLVATSAASSGGQPNAANTGVPAGTALTVHNGDITVTQDGAVISGLDVHGQIKVQAANVIIRDNIVRGTADSRNGLIVALDSKVKNLTVQDNTIIATTPNIYIDSLVGHDFNATGNDMSQTVDGIGVFNTGNSNGAANVTIQGNYIHDLSFMAHDPNHSDGHSHNDGIQIQGNSKITITGNTINANASTKVGDKSPYGVNVTGQAIGLTPNVGAITNVTISGNWLDYGNSTITIIPGKFGSKTGATITNNVFGGHEQNHIPLLIDVSLKANMNVSGNKMAAGSSLAAKYLNTLPTNTK